mgnify:CR=1 FL=1
MIRAKKGFILRRLGQEYMVVPVGEAGRDFNGMLRLNETGAFYWREIEKGITKEQLIEKMLERYEELDKDIACKDLEEFLEEIKVALESEDEHS